MYIPCFSSNRVDFCTENKKISSAITMPGSGPVLWLGVVSFLALCPAVIGQPPPPPPFPCNPGTFECGNYGIRVDACSCTCLPGGTGVLCDSIACPSGWFWSLEARMCLPCNIGTIPDDSRTSCTKCAAGETTLERGATECVPIGEWGPWVTGACSVTCDTGVQMRRRQCNYPSSAAQHVDCVGSNEKLAICQEADCSGISTLEIITLTLVIVIIVIIIPGGCIIIVCRRPVNAPGPRPVPRPIPYPVPLRR